MKKVISLIVTAISLVAMFIPSQRKTPASMPEYTTPTYIVVTAGTMATTQTSSITTITTTTTRTQMSTSTVNYSVDEENVFLTEAKDRELIWVPVTTSSTTTTISTETTTVTTATVTTESPYRTTVEPVIVYATEYNPEASTEPTVTTNMGSLNYITEEERIMLCNVVAGEYGSDWISIYDKACVIAVVMNRYYDGGWTNGQPNTIYNVLTAPYQFDGFYANSSYNWNVTESCIDAVEYYFQHQDEFPHYTSFYGDGYRNYFR